MVFYVVNKYFNSYSLKSWGKVKQKAGVVASLFTEWFNKYFISDMRIYLESKNLDFQVFERTKRHF